MRILSTLLLTTLAGSIAAHTVQQDPSTQKPRTNPAPEAVRTSGGNQNDAILATWIVSDLESSLEIARLAQQRAQHPDVKALAQKMIDEHPKLVQKLQPFAGPSAAKGAIDASNPRQPAGDSAKAGGADDASKPKDPHQDSAANRAQGTGTGKPAMAQVGGTIDHIGLIEELSQQCLETARKELGQKQGAEFDQCFVGMALGGYTHANDKLTVFQRHSSSALKTALGETQKTVAMQLESAKGLAKRMHGNVDRKPQDAGTSDGSDDKGTRQ